MRQNMTVTLQEPLVCMNYNCDNPLTDYERNRLIKGSFSYFGVHFCRSCRSKLSGITDFKCVKCKSYFHSLNSSTYYCRDCKKHYKRTKRICRICGNKCPERKKVFCSVQCVKEGSRRTQKEWREKHERTTL